MKANYHTHTTRCGHAEGTDEQYVLAAIGAGYDTLGFSDHVPYPYKSGFANVGVRMTMDKLPGYVRGVRALKEKYAGKIRILAGFECEYFPEYMGWMKDMKEENQLDYLILGNHYELTDEGGMYTAAARPARSWPATLTIRSRAWRPGCLPTSPIRICSCAHTTSLMTTAARRRVIWRRPARR